MMLRLLPERIMKMMIELHEYCFSFVVNTPWRVVTRVPGHNGIRDKVSVWCYGVYNIIRYMCVRVFYRTS